MLPHSVEGVAVDGCRAGAEPGNREDAQVELLDIQVMGRGEESRSRSRSRSRSSVLVT